MTSRINYRLVGTVWELFCSHSLYIPTQKATSETLTPPCQLSSRARRGRTGVTPSVFEKRRTAKHGQMSSIWHKRWVSHTDYIQLVSVSLHHDVKLLAWFGQQIQHLRHFFQTCVPHSATSFSSCFHVSHRDHMKSSTSNSWRDRTVTSTSL